MPASLFHRITTLRPKLFWALPVATVALVLAGCGSASPTSTTGSAASGDGPPGNMVSQAFKFATCMRDHGVTNFPDPQVSTSGTETSIRMDAPTGTPRSVVASGAKACRGILPAPRGGGQQVSDGPGKQALLEIARCIRSDGFPRFPDPTAQGQLNGEMVSGAGIDMEAPGFLHTAENCASATHGQITAAMVAQFVNHATGAQSASSGNGQ